MLPSFVFGGYSSAPLTQYINNPIYHDMTEEDKYGTTEKDDSL